MAGSKIKDDKQEYQYTVPWVTPSGHEFTFYDTPENERLIVKHSSGSRIEFKADGSIFIISVKDIHTHGSILSSQDSQGGTQAESSTLKYDADLNLEVGGRLSIKAQSIDIEGGEYIHNYAGTDFRITGNNIIEKATESIALEGTKSIYVDTKEYKERSVIHKVEEGTKEDRGEGGMNVLNVHGEAVIRNDDETGGITIQSAGYLSLVCGKERIDIVGRNDPNPESQAVGTFTQKVFTPQAGQEDVSTVPGDYYFESQAGAYYRYGLNNGASSQAQDAGLREDVVIGNRVRNVDSGNEAVTISGMQRVSAQKIFLN